MTSEIFCTLARLDAVAPTLVPPAQGTQGDFPIMAVVIVAAAIVIAATVLALVIVKNKQKKQNIAPSRNRHDI